MELMQGIVGHVCYIVVVFVAGALVGAPLWNWIKAKMPWSN